MKQRNIENVNKINDYIFRNKFSWVADTTTFSFLPYSEKKKYFGNELPNLFGFEYYSGGYFSFPETNDTSNNKTFVNKNYDIVPDFDWRNRHGANRPGTPYFDGDNIDYSGWNTTRIETQGPSDCWAFSAVYSLEALVNLYYNQHFNLNLSEQDMISCSGGQISDTCSGGKPWVATEYVSSTGIVDESCFNFVSACWPYQPSCTSKCNNPQYRVKATSNSGIIYSPNSNTVKETIITNGPVVGIIHAWGHAMSLEGYGRVQEGEVIYNGIYAPSPGIHVLPGSPDIGRNYYIFKNSWGYWGSPLTPYAYILLNKNSLAICYNSAPLICYGSQALTDNDIRCLDEDGDGYFWWGVGPKPITCPTCPAEEDCDDSNPWLGPYDTKYNCTLICDNFIFDNNEIVINENIVWFSDQFVNSNIRIKSGKSLTIKSTVNLQKYSKIIVEPNAKLIIDGGELTNGCGEMWQGIEVHGNSALSQFPSSGAYQQGIVQIINGGTIENAVCGIKTINSDASNPSVTTGGIIRADKAVFHNCKTAIEFLPYQNYYSSTNHPPSANLSLITKCTFETDDNLYAQGTEPTAFISLAGVQGIKIFGNTFTNTTTQNVTNRGIGILSTFSSFDLLAVCISTYPCAEENKRKNTFNGLQYGVWASSTGSQFNIQINNCTFAHNFGSISLNEITSAIVIDNTIDVGPRPFSGDAPWDMSFGLTLEQCTGYTVEENNFTTTENGSYGVIVRNSGSFPNIIYKNTFDGSIVPFHVDGTNGFSSMILRSGNGDISSPALFSGLVLKCNDFQGTNTLWDIEIPWGSISPFQGSLDNDQTPAGNQFDHPVNPYLGRIAVTYGVSPFTYFHHSDPIMTPYISPFFNSYHVITKYPCGAMSTNSCLPNSSNCDPSCLIDNITLYANLLKPLNNQIIKGNNQDLLNRVLTANTSGGLSFATLRDTLLNVSPYLSDTILIAAIEKYDTIEPVMLKDVMVANSPLTNKVKTALIEKALPLSIRQAIDSVQSGISARYELEAQISDTTMLMGLAENELVRQYMNDTTIAGIDSVISYFLTKTDDLARKTLVQAYFTKGDSANLIPALDSLRLQTYEDTLFKEFFTLMADFCTNKTLLYEMDTVQEQTIRDIAASNTEAAVHAQAVLTMVYNETTSLELEKLNIPDSLSIHGFLKSDSLCNGLTAAGDTLVLLDADTNRIIFITPVITDSTGYFVFYLPELLKLSDTALYGFGDADGTPVKNFELKTISQWVAASPLNLTLRKTEADFIFDTIRCYAGSVHFTSIVTGGKKPYTYLWDFGNDSVATSPYPAMLYDTSGAYNVTLAVSSADGCTDTVNKTVVVNPLPAAAITPTSATICIGDSATLTASGGISYLWNTSDTSAVITVAPDGTTVYSVTVTSAEGCSNTASITITVNPLPTAAINSADSTICAGDSATLTASGGISYLWNTADSTAAITVTPDTTTDYTVTVTSEEGCSNTASFTITVNPLPTAAINSSDSTICAGDSATLTASGGVIYLWNTADSTAAITVVPDSTTGYMVTVTNATGCAATANYSVTIACADITGRTMYAGKANPGTAPNPPTYNSRIYDINKEIVILKNQSGTEIARDTSDTDGAFDFSNINNGNYTLAYDKYTADTMQWCNNVNSVDISLILYYIGHDTTTDPSRNFSRIYKKAADVNNNGTVDSIDKAKIQAKIGYPNNTAYNFPKGNWVNLDTTISVNGSNVNVTIPVISYGDYNASSSKYKDSANTWSQVKAFKDENVIFISDESIIINNSGLIEIPLRISSSLNDFSAMGLELFYTKEQFKLVSASMPNTSDSNGVLKINPTLQEIIDNNNDLLVTDDSGIIRVVFATTNIFD
ncbi:MAG TPA: C1 family peptidase, partial [Bacteroidales bacterium]|nr:C1 family peptidase [Bacteroidales bacterium]